MPATKESPKTHFYVNAVVQDPRAPTKGIPVLISIKGAKDAGDAQKVAEKAIPKIKVQTVELADYLKNG